MNIYVSHSKALDFQTDLYTPLKTLSDRHTFIFPHENNELGVDSKDIFKQKKCDLVLAEVSVPATGQGIELGWADMLEIPIVCIYKNGTKISGSLKRITDRFYEYQNSEELLELIKKNIL